MSINKPVAIDLFSGVGGMSLGVRQAGFRVAGAFDIEDRHVAAYKRNFRGGCVEALNLANVTGEGLRTKVGAEKSEIDLLFGGPPCQGFSVGGRRDDGDERNLLLLEFARLIAEIQPKYFMIENVLGLTIGNARRVLNRFTKAAERAGYILDCEYLALDASNYGVPQRRKRIFIIGRQKKTSEIVVPQHNHIIGLDGHPYKPLVKDAIMDLPIVDRISRLFHEDGFAGTLRKPSHYAMLMREEVREPSDKTAPRKSKRVLTGCLRTRHSDEVIKRFDRTMPGKSEPVSRYFRLSLDGISPTIRAGTGADKGSHTAPRPIHPTYPRCITVREAARLHSFPDWFQFDPTRWHAFRQIGNSVPPRLARSVAAAIVKQLT